jgi:hypothetical protein
LYKYCVPSSTGGKNEYQEPCLQTLSYSMAMEFEGIL